MFWPLLEWPGAIGQDPRFYGVPLLILACIYFWTGSHHLLSTFLFSSRKMARASNGDSSARSLAARLRGRAAIRAESQASPALVKKPPQLPPPPPPPDKRRPFDTITIDKNADNVQSQLSVPPKRSEKLKRRKRSKQQLRLPFFKAPSLLPVSFQLPSSLLASHHVETVRKRPLRIFPSNLLMVHRLRILPFLLEIMEMMTP